MKKAVGYERVSTENQVREGFPLEEQKAEIEDFCRRNDLELLAVFTDAGVSGAKANEDEMAVEREGLIEMLGFLSENHADYVVVLNTNRLWRSDFAKVLIQKELKKNGVDVKAVDRPGYSIYSSNPNDILVNGMFELLDVYERLEVTLKLKRGRIQKAKNGGYAGGGAPYGYRSSRHGKHLEVNEKEAEAVRHLFLLKDAEPGITLQNMADIMNEEGYRGRNGKAFNSMLVKRILGRKDFYRGKYRYGTVESRGDYQPILEESRQEEEK